MNKMLKSYFSNWTAGLKSSPKVQIITISVSILLAIGISFSGSELHEKHPILEYITLCAIFILIAYCLIKLFKSR